MYVSLKTPKLQQCPFSLSHLSVKSYDQNNEKPRREGQNRFPWSLVYLKFLNKTCTSNVFAEFLLREFIRWFSRRKGASPARLRLVNKWCHRHAQYVIQPCHLVPVRRFPSPSRSIRFGDLSEAIGPRDPKRFGRAEKWGLGIRQRHTLMTETYCLANFPVPCRPLVIDTSWRLHNILFLK